MAKLCLCYSLAKLCLCYLKAEFILIPHPPAHLGINLEQRKHWFYLKCCLSKVYFSSHIFYNYLAPPWVPSCTAPECRWTARADPEDGAALFSLRTGAARPAPEAGNLPRSTGHLVPSPASFFLAVERDRILRQCQPWVKVTRVPHTWLNSILHISETTSCCFLTSKKIQAMFSAIVKEFWIKNV